MSQMTTQPTNERDRTVTYNDIIVKHLGRDLLREIPKFEYFRFPQEVLRNAKATPRSLRDHSSLISLPNEVLVTIFKYLRLRHCVKLARSCKFLASLAVEQKVFVPSLMPLWPSSASDPYPLELLKIRPSGAARCLHCDWHGDVGTDFFFRHHQMEMIRLGHDPVKGCMWLDALCCLVEALNEPRDLPLDGGRIPFLEVLTLRVQLFDQLKEDFEKRSG